MTQESAKPTLGTFLGAMAILVALLQGPFRH